MRVVKWGKGLAVPLPGNVAHALGLKEGDDVQLEAAGTGRLSVARPDPNREAALATLRALARPAPPGFSREDASARPRRAGWVSLPFLDSNVPVYALTEGDRRQDVATALLAAGGTISVQVLNEVATVARRKLGFTWPEVRQALAALRALCPPPLPLTTATHQGNRVNWPERVSYMV